MTSDVGGPGTTDTPEASVGFAGSSRADTTASLQGGSVMWRTARRMSLFRTGFGYSGAWTTMGDSAIVVADGITGVGTAGSP